MTEMTYYLKTKRLKADKSIEDIAKRLKISPASYSKKERGISDWTLTELIGIRKVLKMTDSEVVDIFFDKHSTICE